eukprot:4163485-Lingulodinium_polyedra.AAC.1
MRSTPSPSGASSSTRRRTTSPSGCAAPSPRTWGTTVPSSRTNRTGPAASARRSSCGWRALALVLVTIFGPSCA